MDAKLFALGGKHLAGSAIRGSFIDEDAGFYSDCCSGYRGRDWCEYSRFLRYQYSAAQTADVSRAAIAGAVVEYRAAGIIDEDAGFYSDCCSGYRGRDWCEY